MGNRLITGSRKVPWLDKTIRVKIEIEDGNIRQDAKNYVADILVEVPTTNKAKKNQNFKTTIKIPKNDESDHNIILGDAVGEVLSHFLKKRNKGIYKV